ncbi:MAG: YHS domain-containing protein [Candidatus Limnocylindrales bacterium]
MHAHIHSYDLPATDPVCGMKVAADGPHSEVYRDTTYFFCDPACAATFREDPERWSGTVPLAHDHGDQSGEHRA